jgi:hypothetical protein
MNSHVGSCGLCLIIKELQDSHLLPAATYKLSRINSRRDPNPVVITTKRSSTTSRQVSAYLLCAECENKFSRNGESYIFNQCARPGGEFELRELLEKELAVYVDSKFKVFDVTKLLGERVDQYLYFAASIFWRASAHKWTMEGKPLNLISLGPKYQEEFRLYLLGEAAFPANARIFVHVWSDGETDFTTIFPCTFRMENARRHKFCIPGITFILFLGNDVAKNYDLAALNSAGGHFVWLCQWKDDSLFGSFLDAIKKSQPSASLRLKASGVANHRLDPA